MAAPVLIRDFWVLARPKVKYYGAFPSGFLERARALLGVGYSEDPRDGVLHVCAGKIRDYPFRGMGQADVTVDLDPETKPDVVMDVRLLGTGAHEWCPVRVGGMTCWSCSGEGGLGACDSCGGSGVAPGPSIQTVSGPSTTEAELWSAALVDRPYTYEDAKKYRVGSEVLPDAQDLLRRTLSVVRPGCRVGWLDLFAPRPPKGTRLVAAVGVMAGFENRARIYSVYERPGPRDAEERARARKAVTGK